MDTADIVDNDDFDLSRLHHVHLTPSLPQKCATHKARKFRLERNDFFMYCILRPLKARVIFSLEGFSLTFIFCIQKELGNN